MALGRFSAWSSARGMGSRSATVHSQRSVGVQVAGREAVDSAPLMTEDIVKILEDRLGRIYARQRLGIENDHQAMIFGGGAINFFHIENWYSFHSLIRNVLILAGMYGRGRRNSERIQVRHNPVRLEGLPSSFDGYTLLHISDMHVDMNGGAMRRLIELLHEIDYDVCVLTGDYRGQTHGSFDDTLTRHSRNQKSLYQLSL